MGATIVSGQVCFTDQVTLLALYKLYALLTFRPSDYLFLGSSFQMGKICMYIMLYQISQMYTVCDFQDISFMLLNK